MSGCRLNREFSLLLLPVVNDVDSIVDSDVNKEWQYDDIGWIQWDLQPAHEAEQLQ